MSRTNNEQIKKLIDDARHVLITFRKDGKGDAISSASAMASFLLLQGKQVDMVCDGLVLPHKFTFLPKANDIKAKLPHLQKFMITIDVADAGVQELNYDIKDQKLHIFITPESGFLTKEHIRTAQSEFRHDLIITLDTPDFKSLGDIFTKNTDVFYTVPVINIDHQTHNEHFGHVNVVDITASSTAEVLASLLIELGKEYINASIATALLSGMIARTQSFKSENIRPKTLSLASALIEMGADREYIIQRLYQTKSLSMLRLWGQALAHMNFHKDIGLISSTITREDFVRSNASEQELYDIIDELIVNSPEEKMTLLLHEHIDNGDGKDIHGIFHVEKGLHATMLLQGLVGVRGDNQQASFIIENTSLKQAEEMVVEMIKQQLRQ